MVDIDLGWILTLGHGFLPDEHDGFSHVILTLKMKELCLKVAKYSAMLVQLDQV